MTVATSVVRIPACLVLAFFAEQVLWAWTGDARAAAQAAPVLRLYAIGNGFLALAAFPYYLQFAKGDLKLHLIGNVIFVLLLVPLLVWATWKYGAMGAGYAWLGSGIAYFLTWVPLVHRRFAKGLHHQWLLRDVSQIVAMGVLAASLLHALLPWPQGRVGVLTVALLAGVAVLIFSAAGSDQVRNIVFPHRRAAAI